jgi:hypothetical protein
VKQDGLKDPYSPDFWLSCACEFWDYMIYGKFVLSEMQRHHNTNFSLYHYMSFCNKQCRHLRHWVLQQFHPIKTIRTERSHISLGGPGLELLLPISALELNIWHSKRSMMKLCDSHTGWACRMQHVVKHGGRWFSVSHWLWYHHAPFKKQLTEYWFSQAIRNVHYEKQVYLSGF